jgi:ATP-binding cassette subfamily B protein
MLFGKHINRYYLKYSPILLLGILALVLVDYLQLEIPEIYKNIVNGINVGTVEVDGIVMPFDVEFLLYHVARPMLFIIVFMVLGRFLWRASFFGSAIRLVTDLRKRMFAHSKELSEEYYQINKVGNLMSLYTNDLETVQECFGDGVLMFFDAILLGALAIFKMARMNLVLTLLSLIPMAFLLAVATIVGIYMKKKWIEMIHYQEKFKLLEQITQELNKSY